MNGDKAALFPSASQASDTAALEETRGQALRRGAGPPRVGVPLGVMRTKPSEAAPGHPPWGRARVRVEGDGARTFAD